MATYIEWDETVVEFKEWKYTGGGEFDPVGEERIITRRCLWSGGADEETVKKAQAFVETDRPGGRVVID